MVLHDILLVSGSIHSGEYILSIYIFSMSLTNSFMIKKLQGDYHPGKTFLRVILFIKPVNKEVQVGGVFKIIPLCYSECTSQKIFITYA